MRFSIVMLVYQRVFMVLKRLIHHESLKGNMDHSYGFKKDNNWIFIVKLIGFNEPLYYFMSKYIISYCIKSCLWYILYSCGSTCIDTHLNLLPYSSYCNAVHELVHPPWPLSKFIHPALEFPELAAIYRKNMEEPYLNVKKHIIYR